MGGLFHAARAAQAEAGRQTTSGGNVPDWPEKELTSDAAAATLPFNEALAKFKASEGPNSEKNAEDDSVTAPEQTAFKNADLAIRQRITQKDVPPPASKKLPNQTQQEPKVKYPSYRDLPNSDPSFPGDDQVKWSKAYDQSYGSRNAGYLKPGNAKIETMSVAEANKFNDAQRPPYGPLTRTDSDMPDKLHKAWLGSQRSAVASLGFNLARTVMSPKEDEIGDVLGYYAPSRWGHRKPGESYDHAVGVHQGAAGSRQDVVRCKVSSCSGARIHSSRTRYLES